MYLVLLHLPLCGSSRAVGQLCVSLSVWTTSLERNVIVVYI